MESGRGENGTNTIAFEALSEGCIANILSFTSPPDACRMSLVSKIFRAAADSDAVWDHFLPSDYLSIISRSPSSSSSFLASSSKKGLYLALSDRPIIIDEGKKSFELERQSGKKCYMLSARDLCIIWGDTPRYWRWITLPESRFQQVAGLVDVCWLEIRGVINTHSLSPNIQYAAYLVFKMVKAYGFEYHPVELSVGICGGDSCTKNVCLDPNLEESTFRGLERPRERRDGWLEIEMGKFFNPGLEEEDAQVEMSVVEIKSGRWKCGLIVEGIEVRPKEDN